jgi:hypothetical protein
MMRPRITDAMAVGRLGRPARSRASATSFGQSHPDAVFYISGLLLIAAGLPLLGHLLYALAVVAVLIGGLIAWRTPAVPLALSGVPPLVDAIYGTDPLPSGGFTFLFSAWIMSAVLFAYLRDRRRGIPQAAVLSVPVLASVALLGVMLMRLGISPDQAYGSVKVQTYAADDLIILIGAVFVGIRDDRTRRFILVLVVTDATGSLLFLFQLLTGAAHTAFDGRFSLAAAEYPIDMGRASADGLLLAIYLVISATRPRIRAFAAIAAPVLAITLAAAGSRGPVVAFVFGLLALIGLTATSRRGRRRLGLVAGIFVIAVLVVPLAVPSSTLARALGVIIGSASGLSSNGRTQLWAITLGRFSRHIWLGTGTGSGATLVPGLLYPHNILLEIALETGLVGLVTLLLALGGFVAALGRCWRMTTATDRLLSALLISMFVNELVNAQFSDPIQGNGSIWLWGGLALGTRARLLAVRRREGLLAGRRTERLLDG